MQRQNLLVNRRKALHQKVPACRQAGPSDYTQSLDGSQARHSGQALFMGAPRQARSKQEEGFK